MRIITIKAEIAKEVGNVAKQVAKETATITKDAVKEAVKVAVPTDASNNLVTGLGGTTGNIGEAMFAIRQREAGVTPAPIININVSGAIDSEGTARTIVDTLNDSFFRGTNGARALIT